MAAEGSPAHPAGDPLARRAVDIRALEAGPWDLVIVGGGIVGAGALLDAATRGLRVALVEQDDIASGTSSRSSRLIHGGLRYLEQYQFGVVIESLAERARLLRLAPHLVRLQEFLFPLYGWPLVTRAFYGSGMLLYDILGSARSGGLHRHLGKGGTLEYAPRLRTRGLRGGLVYHDAMEDDARFTLGVVRTAQDLGAVAVTRIRATGPIHDGARIAGIRARDQMDGADLEIRAARVLDATGVWSSRPDRPFGTGSITVLPSRGSHIVVPRERLPVRGGITLRVPGKVVFLVPWPRHWVIGTTDAPYRGPVDRPSASGAEVDEIIETVNRAMDVDLTRTDVVGTYAGLRPLIAPTDAGSTVKLSRGHKVEADADGLVHVSGGKYTTYRVMAAHAVDAALGTNAKRRPSGTADQPIHGALTADAMTSMAAGLAREHGLLADAAESLVDRHGTDAASVAELGAELGLLRPIAPGFPHLEAEIAWAARSEMALSLDDVLARRTRLVHELADRGAAIAPRVADILGVQLGWDAGRRATEIATFLASATREFGLPAAADVRADVPVPVVDATGVGGTEPA